MRYVDPQGQERLAAADTVILALERLPNNELAGSLRGRAPELYEVGDCTEPKNIMSAMHSAYRAARDIWSGFHSACGVKLPAKVRPLNRLRACNFGWP